MRDSLVVRDVSGPFPCIRLNLKFIARRMTVFSHICNVHFVTPCTLHFGAAAQTAPFPAPLHHCLLKRFLARMKDVWLDLEYWRL